MKQCECGCGLETNVGRDSKKYNRFLPQRYQIRIHFRTLKLWLHFLPFELIISSPYNTYVTH